MKALYLLIASLVSVMGDIAVVARHQGDVYAGPAQSERVVGSINAGNNYNAQCHQKGELVNNLGIPSRHWIKLRLDSGDEGYVSKVYLTIDKRKKGAC